MRKRKIEVATCINGEYIFESLRKSRLRKKVVASTAAIASLPITALAETKDVADTFANVHQAVLNAVDSGVVLVIIFAGASWMMGHRSRSIEILIGVACGYLIISHSINLRDFLKSI